MDFIEKARWRYATKKFDTNRKLTPGLIDKLKESMRLAPSSYGLQPFKIIIISNPEIKLRLKAFSWDQEQITSCSHLIVFCHDTWVGEKVVDDYIRLKAKVQNIDSENIKEYGDFIKQKINEKSDVEKLAWARSQTYLALGQLLSACMDMQIDACPMEGFDPLEYNRILGLDKNNLNACALVAVGYRSGEDKTQFQEKVRKPIEVLFEEKT